MSRRDVESLFMEEFSTYKRFLRCTNGAFYNHFEDEIIICVECYKTCEDKENYEPDGIHRLMDVSLTKINCDKCDRSMVYTRNLFECPLCIRKYTEEVRPLELLGFTDRQYISFNHYQV